MRTPTMSILPVAGFLALLACLVMAGPASALAPAPLTPPAGATVELGDAQTFTVAFTAADMTDLRRLKVRVSTSPALDARGVLAAGTDLPLEVWSTPYPYSGGTATFTPTLPVFTGLGARYWQAYADSDISLNRPLEAGPVTAISVVAPPGPTTYSPPSGTTMRATNSPLTFVVTGQSSKYIFGTIRVSRYADVSASGLLGSDVKREFLDTAGGTLRFTPPSHTPIVSTPGTYYWQVEFETLTFLTFGIPNLVTPVQTLTVQREGAADGGGISRLPIPRRVGVPGRGSFRVNTSFEVPGNVSGDYFRYLAHLSGSRWGLTYAGATSAMAGLRDGVSTVGFSSSLGSAVGLTTNWYRSIIVRKRVCRGGKCRRVAVRKRAITEQDMQLTTDVLWEQGPPYPSAESFDLESVLIHEFGHVASARNLHFTGCRNSPMVLSAAPGDYWRTDTDWARRGCGASPAERRSEQKQARRRFADRWIELPPALSAAHIP